MKNYLSIIVSISSLLISTLVVAEENKSVTDNPIIAEFIDSMTKNHGFKKQELEKLFAGAQVLPEIIERMTRPAEALPWHRYRNIFIKQERIDQGVEFWRENNETLRKAEEKFGVPAEIIVAILGVETRYGRHAGTFRLIDSLTTLVVDFPRRSKFFKQELEHMLLLAREEGFDPATLMGSYAGAMGKPQFIASSYRNFAIDFNGDGVRDLLNSNEDAIGSIASYLARHGWERGQPITAEARVNGDKYSKLIEKGLKPKTVFTEFGEYGVKTNADLKADTKVALIELEQLESKEHWIILQNFYAITRYNHSELYAMAAFQLGQNIKQQKEKNV